MLRCVLFIDRPVDQVPDDAPFELHKNPHLLQNEVGFYRVPMERLPVTLQPEMPRKKYAWLARAKRSTMHHGVRKLLLQVSVACVCAFVRACVSVARIGLCVCVQLLDVMAE